MRVCWLLALLATAWLAAALVPLEREQLDGKYEIGTIRNLHFFKDRIFFLSDDDLFGFLAQKDGQLLAVYEMELGEHIVNFAGGDEVVIARGKKLNLFFPPEARYHRSHVSKFLAKHPDFTAIISHKLTPRGSLTLTDKYLLLVPPTPLGTKLKHLQEEVLVELSDPAETSLGLLELYNPAEEHLEIIMVSLLQKNEVSQVCFRRTDGEKLARQCSDLQAGDSVEDVVSSGRFIFVELKAGAIVFDTSFKEVKRLASTSLHYYAGMVTIGQDHQFYDPLSKTLHELLLVDHSGDKLEAFMGLKVEDSLLTLQALTNGTFQTVLSFKKEPEENPRKAWSFSADDSKSSFRLYVEFDDGRLVCYAVDIAKPSIEEVWEFTTIQAEKVATGELEAQEDISEEEGEEQQKKGEKDAPGKQAGEKPEEKVTEGEQKADIAENLASPSEEP